MKETIVRRDETVRRNSCAQFQEALGIARRSFVKEISEEKNLPPVQLTRKQYDSGQWAIPRAYGEIVSKVRVYVHTAMAERYGIRRYQLSRGQRQHAFLEALQERQKLSVAGLLLPQPIQE